VAITELIGRIDGDAAAEAAAIADQAQAEADEILARADAAAAAQRSETLGRARREAADERETLLANARLSARDNLLARKHERAERVLERAQEALETLPDAEYLELIASAVTLSSTGGDTLAVAPADAGRLAGLDARLRQLGVDIAVSAEPAPIEHGVLLSGDRVRVEISPGSLVADMRDQLLLAASQELFGSKG